MKRHIYCTQLFLYCLWSIIAHAHATQFPQTVDSLRYKIGQMVIIGLEGESPSDSLINDIAENNIGGVILYYFHDNVRNPAQIQNLTTEMQSHADIPLFIMTDQEPGRGNLNTLNGFSTTKNAYQLGQLNSEPETRAVADTLSSWLARVGITINLSGNIVREFFNGIQTAGRYQVQWDGTDGNGRPVSSGPYIYRIQAGSHSVSRRMLLIK